ncbi:Mitochondrial thiamine pyrophosphate carrier [Clonorchis sinensis]|uniref:Mitochondrial thiamine pyrophosphate carrier n=3 Tax=Clonorchis sinensis TaxID=79923 RepID=A0A419PF30_CLOSI|nr:Mitochondrial thiamine pyrophosphate carrier [Clonorchis sinensis]
MSPNVEDRPGLARNDYVIAGSVSGFVSRAIVQPLDVLKIRFQLQSEPIRVCNTSKYHGFVQAIRCINKEEGVVAFWKGHIPAQLQAVTFTALQFSTFEVLVAHFGRKTVSNSTHDKRIALRSPNTLGTFICGSLAGSFAAIATQPLDVLRTRFIAQGEPKLYRNIYHAAKHIATHEGLPGYFRGLLPSLLLVTPQTGLQFAIYHACNQLVGVIRLQWLEFRNSSRQGHSASKSQRYGTDSFSVSSIQSIISGGLAGMGAKCIIYPMDMVKKRMQIHGFEEARIRFGRLPATSNIRDCLINIWTTEGASGLFKGLRPTLLKSCLSISCRFTVYEQFCRLLYHIRTTDASSKRTF